MKKNVIVWCLLAVIVLIAIYLRTLSLPGNMLFGYEQGRDAIVVRDMLLNHKFTLLGPQTDIQGIYHGVGYYYVLTLIYLLTHADPGNVILVFTVVNALTCLIVFFLAKEIIGKTRYALLAALMTACSFDIILYGRWLSNVSFSIPLIALFFYCLTRFVKTKNPVYWIVVAPLCGLLSHFELLHMLFAIVTTALATSMFSLPIKNKPFFIGIGLFVLANASFILFDVRHGFLLTSAILHYLTSQPLSENPIPTIAMYFDGLTATLVNSLFPSNATIIFLFMAFLLYHYIVGKKENSQSFKLILLMLFFSFPYIFLLKFGSMEHFYAGTAIAWILLFNFLMSKSEKLFPTYVIFGIYGLLLLGNFVYIQRHLADRYNIFYQSVQKNYTYQDQLAVMEYIFSHDQTPFTIKSVSIPAYHEEAWQYLYGWYGQSKYPQQYTHNLASNPSKEYVIIEPGIYDKFLKSLLSDYNKNTKVISDVQIGAIEVQERVNIQKP